MCDQTRTIDARARRFRRIERAPDALVDEALAAVRSILE
jgi:mRNA interferase ChpB